MVSLANEVHSFHVNDVSKNPPFGALTREPSLYDILSYSYCYVGIMTGKAAETNNVGFNFTESVIYLIILFMLRSMSIFLLHNF